MSCSSKEVFVASKIQRVQIPTELLKLEPLKKPLVQNELDILNAYATLFYHYRSCEIKLNKIRLLNDDQ